MDYIQIMDRLTSAYSAILKDNFVGMYVHGSIAMGCFNPTKSDIDFVCVVKKEPETEEKLRILEKTVALERFAPKKGLEMHILRLEDCLAPSHPCYFCLHYSPAHTQNFLRDPLGYIGYMKGGDSDLGGHLTVLHECGICWKGLPTSEVFGPVPREMYLDSILDDVMSDYGDEIYRICNLCRVWGYLAEGLVLSKRTGAQWALKQDICCKNAIEKALFCYDTGCDWDFSTDAQGACALLKEKIVSLLPEDFAQKYR